MILMHSLRDYDAEKSAARMAVQAAAGALMNVTGHTCNDIVMCSQPREWDDMLEVCIYTEAAAVPLSWQEEQSMPHMH